LRALRELGLVVRNERAKLKRPTGEEEIEEHKKRKWERENILGQKRKKV